MNHFNPLDNNILDRPSRYSDLEQENIHLFEVYDGEVTERSFYSKGQILRGIECGIGWKKPVEQLLSALNFHLKNNCYIENPDKESSKKYIKDPNASIKIFQIKEKFGDARCYVQASNSRLQNLVDQEVAKFEARCELTCEGCGAVGKEFISTCNGWVSCLCEDCKSINSGRQLTFDDYLWEIERESRKNEMSKL